MKLKIITKNKAKNAKTDKGNNKKKEISGS